VPAGHHAGQELIDDVPIADDALADLRGQALVVGLEVRNALGADFCVHG
jgi:hypothetical protein